MVAPRRLAPLALLVWLVSFIVVAIIAPVLIGELGPAGRPQWAQFIAENTTNNLLGVVIVILFVLSVVILFFAGPVMCIVALILDRLAFIQESEDSAKKR